MFFTTALFIIQVAVLFSIKMLIVYFLIRLFKKETKIFTVFKIMLVYETVVYLTVLFYSKIIGFLISALNFRYEKNLPLILFDFLFLSLIFFLIFALLINKFLLLNWKKSIIVFITLSLLMLLLPFLIGSISRPIYNLPVFQKEGQKLGEEIRLEKYLTAKGSLPAGFLGYEKRYPILTFAGYAKTSLMATDFYLKRVLIWKIIISDSQMF